MKEGDLVKRKPEWGDWVKYNPWMLTEKDLKIGMVMSISYWDDSSSARSVKVLWDSGSEILWFDDIEVINENLS